MEVLYTPWRYSYLVSPKSGGDCIFCVAAREGEMQETLTLVRGQRVIVMLNRYPYSNGHLMIAPVGHQARLYETDDAILSELMQMTASAQRILSEVYRPDGFNIGMNFGTVAGAGIADHYHMHVVPRWNGDSNFMTVTAQTRLVPETLEATYDKLHPRFALLRERA